MSKKYLETIKAFDGKVYHLNDHQKRLDSVLAKFSSSQKYNLQTLLNPPKIGLYRCRVVYDTASIVIEYIPYVKRDIKSLKIVYSDTIEYSKKYAFRDEINNIFRKKENCDDILIVKNGFISDTSIANIAFFDGLEWLTPNTPLLEGTTRGRLLKESKIKAVEIRVEDMKKFKKVALMNAMIDFDIIASENIGEIIC